MKKEFEALALSGESDEFGAVCDWRTEARARLLAMGLSERAASSRLGLLAEWMAGFRVGPDVGMSRASWYRYAVDLRRACGVDVTRAPNVVSLGSRMQRQARQWGVNRREEAMALLVETDLTLRSASRAPALAVMERALSRLCTVR